MPTEKVIMKQEYVNAFLNPAKLVWEKELGMELELLDAGPVPEVNTPEDIIAVIGISGKLQGNVLYGFGSASALSIAGKMMGEPVEEVDDVCLSILGELANMITGNAATELASEGYVCDIAPPVIIEPAGRNMVTPGDSPVLVRFNSEAGRLNIRISLSEAS
ncbi:MAG: chemotaxis protein CheX [Chloroflexi bacterium]|nr:chemotaxis protein CheX [Chloroflexota bacterium]